MIISAGVEHLTAVGEEPAIITPSDQVPLGEAANIYTMGGSYLSLLADNRWFHHPDDRWPDTVDLARTVRLIEAAVAIATAMAEAPDSE